MQDFVYYAPTKVHFGKGKYKEVGAIIKSYGFDTIMLQYGKNSIQKSGLYDAVMASLKENGIRVVEMGGVEPNPKITFVRRAIRLAKEEKVQLILAVGGGSVIDSCKYTATGAMYDGDVFDFPSRKSTPVKALPVGCILTHAAAGSEMSSSAVITNLDTNLKRGYNSDFNRCLFAICDPELTYTVSPYQTACGIVDLMTHTLERYFTLCPATDLTDRISESLLKAVIDAGKVLMKDPCNYEARATVMWASSLSHNDLTGCGRINTLVVHQLEHALSGLYDHVAHGAGLAVLYPAWAYYVYQAAPGRFAQLARRVWDVEEADDLTAARKGIDAMAAYFVSLGMPARLKDFGLQPDCTDALADLCTYGRTRTLQSYLELDYNAIKNIFDSCM